MNNVTEATLLDAAVQALRGHGIAAALHKEPRTKGYRRADALLRVGKDQKHIDYVVEVKRNATPATVGAIVTQLRHAGKAAGRPSLLVTDYLTPPLANQLRAQKQQFADTAGNTYLEGPGLLVYVTGLRREVKHAPARANRAFATAGLKLLFALICDPELADAPHRAIAAAAGVALGSVPPVLAELQQAGYVLIAEKRRRLNVNKRLLDDWALAYARTLRAKTLVGKYVAQNFEKWRDWKLDGKARWGGEPAASLLVRYLKPGVLTIYAEKIPARLIVQHRLVIAGPSGFERLVEVRRPFWGETLRTDGRADVVPTPLVYADLLATGEARCIETAQILYERCLAELFPSE